MREKYIDYIGEYNKIEKYLRVFHNIPEEAMDFAFSIYGVNKGTVDNLIYHYTAYRDIYQLAEYEDKSKSYKLDFGLELFEEDEEEE